MVYQEIQGDLFEHIGDNCWYLQSISADYDMSDVVAQRFIELFDIKNKLLSANPYTMEFAWTRRGTIANNLCPPFLPSCVICLVPKQYHWEKATLPRLKESLATAKRYMDMGTIRLVRLPKIGCGFDKLSWKDVREVIKQVFTDSDYILEVYSLDGFEE